MAEAKELCEKAQKGDQLRLAEAALRLAEERQQEATKRRKTLEDEARKLERQREKMSVETRGRPKKVLVEPESTAILLHDVTERAMVLHKLRQKAVKKRQGDGKQRLKREPKPQERKAITDAMDAQLAQDGREGKEFWEAASIEHNLAVTQLKNLLTDAGRKKTKKGMLAAATRGRKRYWQTLLRYRSTGQRQPREDLLGGPLKKEKEAVKAWCKEEMSQGNDVSGADLLYQYESEVEDFLHRLKVEREAKVACEQLAEALKAEKAKRALEAKRAQGEEKQPEAEGAQRVEEPQPEIYTGRLLSQIEADEKEALVAQARLSALLGKPEERSEAEEQRREAKPENQLVEWLGEKEEEEEESTLEKEQKEKEDKQREAEKFLETGLLTRQARCYHKQVLLAFCDVVERKPDLVFPITEEEAKLVCQLSWNSFDRVLHILLYGSMEQLADFVAEPEKFRENIENLPVAATDAVPIYLDVSTDKVLVPCSVLDASAKRRLAKRLGKKVEEVEAENLHITASGESRQDKDRLTWLCGQVAYGYFQKSKQGKVRQRVTGKMLKSILLVHCNTHCRLEWICPVTDTWLVSHSFSENGKLVERKKGDAVPSHLMKSWRELRKLHPHFFRNVLVWGQKKGYMDEIICSWHSQKLEEELGGPCLHLVDMFSGELTETMEALNFGRGQVKIVIGPKVTSKIQPTDIYFSQKGKSAMTKQKIVQRRAMRRKAKQQGVAAKLAAGCFEMMETVNAAHSVCAEAAETGAVERAFRKAAWFAMEPGQTRLEKAEGARWEGLPLGGSNLSKAYLDRRFAHFDEDGVPRRPDWGLLHKLRMEQREAARRKTDEHKKGTQKSVMASLKEGSNIKKEEERHEEQLKELARAAEEENEKDASLGFTQVYLTQDDYAEEPEKEKEHEPCSISLEDIGHLEDMEGSAWWRLPPKRRREVIENAREQATTSQAPGALEKRQQQKAGTKLPE